MSPPRVVAPYDTAGRSGIVREDVGVRRENINGLTAAQTGTEGAERTCTKLL